MATRVLQTWLWDLKSGAHARAAVTLVIELSPQPRDPLFEMWVFWIIDEKEKLIF